METNSYKMISLPEVRDRVKLRLKQFNTTINDDAIDLFIMDASRDIMSKKKVEPKTESIEIVDFAAPLPCDFDTLLAIVTSALISEALWFMFFKPKPFCSIFFLNPIPLSKYVICVFLSLIFSISNLMATAPEYLMLL